jgi:HAD superfamily hydrolase (TIGR01509 family)
MTPSPPTLHSPTGTLKALIWDVDGTLAETERDGHRVAFNRAFADMDLPWVWDEATYGELLGVAGGKERLAAWWRRIDPQAASGAGAGAFVARVHALKTKHYVTLVESGALVLRPGVERLLREALATGLRLAIATTTTRANLIALLTHALGAHAAGWFDVIGAGDVVPHKKPAPDIYHWVLAHLRLQAAETLAMEDSSVGVASARAAGIPVLAVRSTYTQAENFDGALAVLDSLEACGAPPGGPVTLAVLQRLHRDAPRTAITPTSA